MPIGAKHTEARFEDAVEHHLLNHDRYIKGDSKDYDPELALEPHRIIEFIQSTQSKTWAALRNIHGADIAKVILADLTKHLETKGMLNVN